MARIEPRWLFSESGELALPSGYSMAPHGSLLLLIVPTLCRDNRCEIRLLCVALSVVAAASLYVLLGLIRELRLLGERLTF
jgi:hypothetical protein